MKKKLHRIWHTSAISFGIRASHVRLRNVLRGGPRPLRLLLISDGGSYTSEQQFAPILRHAALLRDRFGVILKYCQLENALTLDFQSLSRFDLIGLKLSFRTPAGEADRFVRHFKTTVAGAKTRLVYFDGDDDLNVQWPAILRMVDLYIKKHVFADNNAYLLRYIGKNNLTDFIAKKFCVSFADDIIPTSGGVDPLDLSKIYLGWNIALDDIIVELFQRLRSTPVTSQDIDILCRAPVLDNIWIKPLRAGAIERIEGMSNRYRVVATRDRVPKNKYYKEMLRSRICVSPFGYGEICWRDFEAILCGCLLIKPSMDHLKTVPNLFMPSGTYVPVKWDYSDLEAKCTHYLQSDKEREGIVERARETLIDSLQAEWFLDRFYQLLFCAGVVPRLESIDDDGQQPTNGHIPAPTPSR
jgi:hypothetical protein